MWKTKNNVTLIGFVKTEPTVVYREGEEGNETIGVKFKLNTSETFYSKKKEKTIKQNEWHLVKVWNANAKYVLENITIGSYIYIEGKIHYHEKKIEEENKLIRNPEIIVKELNKLSSEKEIVKDDSPDDNDDNQTCVV